MMKYVKTKGLVGALLLLFMIGFAGCNNDNSYAPITLADREGSNIEMFWRGEETSEYAMSLQGGDGNYSVRSGDEEVVVVEMITSNLHLKPTGIGETIVTVTDNSGNSLTLNARVNYETHRLVVVRHDVSVTGGNPTGNEVKTIREQQLAQILVKVGRGYKFTFTDASNGKGVAEYPQAELVYTSQVIQGKVY